MRQYFIHDGQSEVGPFTLDEIKSQRLSKTTPVWYDGLYEWTTVQDVPELAVLVTAPPTYGQRASVPPPLDTYREETVAYATNKKSYLPAILTGSFVVVGIVGWLVYSNLSQASELQAQSVQLQQVTQEQELKQLEDQQKLEAQRKAAEAAEKKKSDTRNNWFNYIQVDHGDYQYREIGGIFNLEVKVLNSTDYLLDDVTASVMYIKANGDIWKTVEVPISNVAAKSEKSVSLPDETRGVSVQVRIDGISSKEMNFCYAPGNWANNSEDPYYCK